MRIRKRRNDRGAFVRGGPATLSAEARTRLTQLAEFHFREGRPSEAHRIYRRLGDSGLAPPALWPFPRLVEDAS
jgi:hypothetical protein